MRKALILATALLVVGAVAAVASVPDAQGVIHGCRKNSGGALRVIDIALGQTCASNEKALNWEAAPRPGTPYGMHIVSAFEEIPTDGVQHVVFVGCPVGEQAISLSGTINDYPSGIQGVIRPYFPAHNWAGTLDVPVRGYYVFVDAASSGDQPSLLSAELLCAKVMP
jgi:hypothetical protein